MTLEDKVGAHYRLEIAVVWCIRMFYTNDNLIVSQDSECLQGALNVLICLLQWYGRVANFVKSKSMMCQPGPIWSEMSEEEVGRRSTIRGVTYK